MLSNHRHRLWKLGENVHPGVSGHNCRARLYSMQNIMQFSIRARPSSHIDTIIPVACYLNTMFAEDLTPELMIYQGLRDDFGVPISEQLRSVDF